MFSHLVKLSFLMNTLSVLARTMYKQSVIFLYFVIFDVVNKVYLVQEIFYLSELISQFSALRSIVKTKIDAVQQ
jgi:hypothetical protein